MESVRPDPKSVSLSDPDRLLPEDDKITFEISKKEPAGPPALSPSSSLTEESGTGNNAVLDDDSDGFRTPVNQRIPLITECPPAPKKTRMPLRKRKALHSPISARKRIQVNISDEEFDALFQFDIRGKIKKGAV